MDMIWIRDAVKNVPKYRNTVSWGLKVDKMEDDQVYAIHQNFLDRGMYEQKVPRQRYEQLTLFDLYPNAMKGVK